MGIDYWQTVHAAVAKDAEKPIPRRRFKKGIKLSIVGFGGIVVVGQAQSDANDEVARAVLFLASEGTDFLTGCVVDVNGASYLRT